MQFFANFALISGYPQVREENNDWLGSVAVRRELPDPVNLFWPRLFPPTSLYHTRIVSPLVAFANQPKSFFINLIYALRACISYIPLCLRRSRTMEKYVVVFGFAIHSARTRRQFDMFLPEREHCTQPINV